MARLIKTSGEILPDVDISTLKKMQDLVGGYIEFIYLGEKVLVVNEEGLLDSLEYNPKASAIYGNDIVGDVIQCGIKEIN
jgi:hypothetical protein|tara:strand:+ start:454 stop:693 length:240 start_codon:yes stop_codon:yes gene_type:complete